MRAISPTVRSLLLLPTPPQPYAEELERLKREWMGEAEAEPVPLDEARQKRTAAEALEAATRKLGLHSVRFDLGGRQIDPSSADTIDVSEGLHHHGEAPAAPGYTLAELSRLARSTVPAQRSQALLTLAGVLGHAAFAQRPRVSAAAPTTGSADVTMAAATGATLEHALVANGVAVVRWCRDADTAVLLRVALDDGSTSCVHAALRAADALAEASQGSLPLGSLLADATRVALSHRGGEALGFASAASRAPGDRAPGDRDAASGEGAAETDTETDAALCRRSLIEGWVRMGICGRLRYLLDSGDLAPAGEADALALLCRCAHTSLSCASDVARTPHLLASLRTLLQARSPARPTLRLVLTLLQLLCAASRGLASLVLQAGTLHCCHATLAGAFRVDIVSGTIAAPRQPLPAGDPTAAATSPAALLSTSLGADDLAAAVIGLWRCCAAYSLSEPPLDSYFPLFSQATSAPCGVMSTAIFSLLETLCYLPQDARLVRVDAAPQGSTAGEPADGASAEGVHDEGVQVEGVKEEDEEAEAEEAAERAAEEAAEEADVAAAASTPEGATIVHKLEASLPSAHAAAPAARPTTSASKSVVVSAQDGVALDAPPLGVVVSAQDGGLSGRWRFLSAYVPSALTALRAADASIEGLVANAAGEGHGGSMGCDRVEPPTRVLAIVDAARQAAASAQMVASYVAALQALQPDVHLPLLLPWCEQLSDRLAASLQRGGVCMWALATLRRATTTCPSSRLEVGAAVDYLLGLVRLLWQLSRTHRGLLARWAKVDGASLTVVAATLWDVCQGLPEAIGSIKPTLHDPRADQESRGEATVESYATSVHAASVSMAATAPTGRALLAASGRLGHLTVVLIDAIDAASTRLPSVPLNPASPSVSPDAATSRGAARLISLALCAATWMRPGDEVACRTLVTNVSMSTRWLRRLIDEEHAQTMHADPSAPSDADADAHQIRAAMLPTFSRMLELGPAEETQARARATPSPTELAALSVSSSASPLPLPPDWLWGPCHQFGIDAGDKMPEARVLSQLGTSLRLLRLLLAHPPLCWAAPSRLLCRGLATFNLPGTPWRDTAVARALDAIFDGLTAPGRGGGEGGRGGGGRGGGEGSYQSSNGGRGPQRCCLLGDERRVDVAELLRSVLETFTAESYGDPTFSKWILLGMRTEEPESVKLATWHALEELAHKLPMAHPAPDRVQQWFARGGEEVGDEELGCGVRAASDPASKEELVASEALLKAFEASLLHGKLREAPRSSFLYCLALHHLAAAAFGGGAGTIHLNHLVQGATAEACVDLCRATRSSLRGGLAAVETEEAVQAAAVMLRRSSLTRAALKEVSNEMPAAAVAAVTAELGVLEDEAQLWLERRDAHERQTGRAARGASAREGESSTAPAESAKPVNRVFVNKLTSALDKVLAEQEDEERGSQRGTLL